MSATPFSVVHLRPTDQDLIKRALLVYYEQCVAAYHNSPEQCRDLDDETTPTELELTMMEIAAMYGALTGEEIPNS